MKCEILAIDAWADCTGCECEENAPKCWQWNNWHTVGKIHVPTDFPDNLFLDYLIEEGFLKKEAKTLCEIEDDGFNLICVNKETREPIFALEYGPNL